MTLFAARVLCNVDRVSFMVGRQLVTFSRNLVNLKVVENCLHLYHVYRMVLKGMNKLRKCVGGCSLKVLIDNMHMNLHKYIF